MKDDFSNIVTLVLLTLVSCEIGILGLWYLVILV